MYAYAKKPYQGYGGRNKELLMNIQDYAGVYITNPEILGDSIVVVGDESAVARNGRLLALLQKK